MIHVNASRSADPTLSTLHFSLVGVETIKEFHALLDRSLNCLPPEKHKDWVTLSDRLHAFLNPPPQER